MGQANKAVVLVVEDEKLVRLNVVQALEDAGFKVVACANGREAEGELTKAKGPVEALLTDIRLGPAPDGWAVAREAREIMPDIAVAYVSGDSAHEWSTMGVPNSIMVQKPFVLAQLVRAIAQLINEVPLAPVRDNRV